MPDPVRQYVRGAIHSFVDDPPDSPYQRGYLAALFAVWDEALNLRDDPDEGVAKARITHETPPA